MKLPVVTRVDAKELTFARGLLFALQRALRETPPGRLFSLGDVAAETVPEIERWCRLTGNAIVALEDGGGPYELVLRHGPAPDEEPARPVGSRIWVYTNFDCNLSCDYCCVRSSPKTPRDAFGEERMGSLCQELDELGRTRELFLTGGEPFLLEDLDRLVVAGTRIAPVTVLTNGMLFTGRRRQLLDRFPRDRVTLQVSLDSPEPGLHDRHRGGGSWQKARDGIAAARAMGFRVRLAATVSSDGEAADFRRLALAEELPEEDVVIRRMALRGYAEDGVALARADVVPEATFTSSGLYWHPVGAGDRDFLVTDRLFPVRDSLARLEKELEESRLFGDRLASIFHCA